MFHSRVTWLDRWLVKKMVDVVGNFEGDMVEFMEVIYRGISGKGEPGLLRKLILWLPISPTRA